jgi:hypothetical protein
MKIESVDLGSYSDQQVQDWLQTATPDQLAAIDRILYGGDELVDAERAPEFRSHDGVWIPFGGHAGQLESWECTKRIVAIFAGWQSGKSTVGPYWLLREMQRRGPGDYAVIAPHAPMLNNSARPKMLALFRGWIHSSGNEWIITDKGAMAIWGYIPEEPARILFRHAMAPEAIEAFTAKAIWVDEPGQIGDEVWEAIQARAAYHQARILLTSRPYEHNWYVKEIWANRETDDQVGVINFRSVDNPGFPRQEYDRQQGKLPRWKFLMKYDGIPTKPAGAIYDCFDREKNTCKRFPIPDNWPRFKGTDFGPVNTAGVFVAMDPETKQLYGYRTYLRGNIPVKKESQYDQDGHIDNWLKGEPKDRTGQVKKPVDWGGAWSENDWRDEYAQHGYLISRPQIRDVEVGIQLVYTLFLTGRLKIFDDLTNWIQEIEDYSRELDEGGEPIPNTIKDKNKFHRADATRYLAVGVSDGTDFEPVEIKRGIQDERSKQQRDDDDELPSRRELEAAERGRIPGGPGRRSVSTGRAFRESRRR